MISRKRSIILGSMNSFEKNIGKCLNDNGIAIKFLTEIPVEFKKVIDQYKIDSVIINAINKRKNILKELEIISKNEIKKVVLLENGCDLYLNSKNKLPYSVYKPVITKSLICKKMLETEKTVNQDFSEHVIFRVSDVYGPSVNYGLIYDLLTRRKIVLQNCLHDFIYEGDLIHAIEIALREEVSGLFDIASGKSISLKDNLIVLINMLRRKHIIVKWKKCSKDFECNCENFKFYKWEPLVNLEMGLKASLRHLNHHKQLLIGSYHG